MASGAGIGTVARAEGVALTAGETVMLGEFGPSTIGLLMKGEKALSAGALATDYAIKTAGRVDSYLNLKRALEQNK